MPLLNRPGVYIAVVGLLVLLGGALLWRGMVVVPQQPDAHNADGATRTDASAAMSDGAREAVSSALRDMIALAYEEPFETPPEDAASRPEDPLPPRQAGDAARLAIVIDDVGEDLAAARALTRLPYRVTLSIWPRSANARKSAEVGHAAGREILIHQPTEPMRYPEMQPGAGALLTSLTDWEIEARVRESLSRVPHATGMNNHMGSRFTQDRRAAAAMVRPLKERGFFVLDSLTHPGSVLHAEAFRQGVPALKRDVFLDAAPGKEHVLRQLRKAERIALATGRAVAIGHPFPYTLAALKEWGGRRDGRVELVRLSDLLL